MSDASLAAGAVGRLSLQMPTSGHLMASCICITSHRFFVVTLMPALNYDTALQVAETTTSGASGLPTFVRCGSGSCPVASAV